MPAQSKLNVRGTTNNAQSVIPNIICDIFKLKQYLLFILNSNLVRQPEILFAKS